MNLFYCPDIPGDEALLSNDESFHCIRVLRLGKGDPVQVIDGKGGRFNAMITHPDARSCRLRILDTVKQESRRDFTVHIAIAPTKNMDRLEWFIEKAVEIGIDTITPLLCERSERRVLKTERIQKLIIATLKQAMVPFRPVLNELTAVHSFIASVPVHETSAFIAHCMNEEKSKLADVYRPGKNAVVLIGPEGDFTPSEIQYAIKNGFSAVTLGPNRLRTETAGLVACHTLNLLNE